MSNLSRKVNKGGGCALQVEAIRERLEAEFTALEAANVHAILDSAASVPRVVGKVDAAFARLDDLEVCFPSRLRTTYCNRFILMRCNVD